MLTSFIFGFPKPEFFRCPLIIWGGTHPIGAKTTTAILSDMFLKGACPNMLGNDDNKTNIGRP